METSEKIDLIGTAFAKAQSELQNPPKNKTNPHFNSKYVDLSDGLDTIRKTLSKHGLAFIQATKAHEGIIILHTRIIHSSGQWIESTYPVSGLEKHQAMGSALTYARRYALFAMVGVAGEDDDDGNSAAEVKPAPKAKAKTIVSPEDSEKIFKTLSDLIGMAKTLDDLKAWAVDDKNKDAKSLMLPEHQTAISAKFAEKKKALSENA